MLTILTLRQNFGLGDDSIINTLRKALVKRVLLTLLCFAFILIPFASIAWSRADSEVVFTVTNSNASGPGSFQQAILDSNAAAASNKSIIINPDVQTIFVSSPMTTLILNNDTVTIQSNGSRLVEGLSVDMQSGATLILIGTHFDNFYFGSSIPSIYVHGEGENQIKYYGYNSVTSFAGNGLGLYVADGSSLTLNGDSYIDFSGIVNAMKGNDIRINGGTVSAYGYDDAAVQGNVTVTGGVLKAYEGRCGLDGSCTVSGGAVYAIGYNSPGMIGKLTVNSGLFYAKYSEDEGYTAASGGEAPSASTRSYGGAIVGEVTVNGGSLVAIGDYATGIYSTGNIRISDGIVHVTGSCAVYGSGEASKLSVSGGTVRLAGANTDVFMESNKVEITGGSVNTRAVNCDVTDADGKTLYLTAVTVGETPVTNTAVACSINGCPDFQSLTDDSGKLYLWLPATEPGEKATVRVRMETKQYWATGAVEMNYNNTMTAYGASVTSVEVSPAAATVIKGTSLQFSVAVYGYFAPQDVLWTVAGGQSGTTISELGLLTVASDETSDTLTVTATSAYDMSKSGTAAVSVPQTCAVQFDSRGGSEVPGQTVPYNGLVAKPDDPVRAGQTFSGWFKDEEGTQPWDFTADRVTSDITLYAAWTVDTYSVQFNSRGGSEVPGQTVPYDSLITKPDDPVLAGYSFSGWFKDEAGTQPWNFESDRVTTDITLIAKWTAIPIPAPTPTPIVLLLFPLILIVMLIFIAVIL